MTVETSSPTPTKPPRRKITTLGAILIGLGAIVTAVILVFVITLIGAFMSYNGTVLSHPNTANKSVTPHELITETLGWAGDTAETAGGTWRLFDETHGKGQPWDPNSTVGYGTNGCGGSNAAQYVIVLQADGSADPVAAAKRMMAHWKTLGYSARYVGATDPTNGNYTEIAADLPNGASISYSTHNDGDSITAYGQCAAVLANGDLSK